MQGYNPNWGGLLSATAQQSQALGQLGGLAGQTIAQNRAQAQAAERKNQAQTEISGAIQSGDPNQIAQVSLKYPQMSEAIRSAFNFKNDATEKNFLDTNFKILSDPQNAEKYLNERANYVQSIGGDPAETLGRIQMLKSNPEQFIKTTEGITAATSPERYNAYKSSQPKEITPYQQAQLDADKEKLTFDQQFKRQELELKKAEIEGKKLDRQIQRENSQAKLEDLKSKKEANQAKIDQANAERDDQYLTSMDTMARTIETAENILNSDGFSNFFGTNFSLTSPSIMGAFPPGSAGADTAAMVDTLKSQGFLSGVQQMKGMGALSDAEGKKISDAIGNLSGSQSEASARRTINSIISTVRLAQKRMSDKYGKSVDEYYKSRPKNLSDEELLAKYSSGN